MNIRELSFDELDFVAGGGTECYVPCEPVCKPEHGPQGNNGYGNGGNDGSPGNSNKQDCTR